MEYPTEILPSSEKEYISPLLNYWLIRHTNENDIWDDELDMLNESAVCSPKTNMPDLSCSLLGVFKEEHSKIWIKNKDYLVYCEPKESVSIPKLEEDFEVVLNRNYWLLNVSKIENISVRYNRDNVEYSATCHVRHTPMKWNVYHISINWYLEQEKKYWHELSDELLKKGWSKEKLSSRTRSEIRVKVGKLRIEDLKESDFYTLNSC